MNVNDLLARIFRDGGQYELEHGTDQSIRDADKKIADLYSALTALSVDMHQVSSRPCGTCREMTRLFGQPFGCYEYQENKKK